MLWLINCLCCIVVQQELMQPPNYLCRRRTCEFKSWRRQRAALSFMSTTPTQKMSLGVTLPIAALNCGCLSCFDWWSQWMLVALTEPTMYLAGNSLLKLQHKHCDCCKWRSLAEQHNQEASILVCKISRVKLKVYEKAGFKAEAL